jgi:hypothetical protein
MQIARTQGFLIEEAIDDAYILAIDENYVSPGQRALNDGTVYGSLTLSKSLSRFE